MASHCAWVVMISEPAGTKAEASSYVVFRCISADARALIAPDISAHLIAAVQHVVASLTPSALPACAALTAYSTRRLARGLSGLKKTGFRKGAGAMVPGTSCQYGGSQASAVIVTRSWCRPGFRLPS
jgi:hypothetical protein